MVASDPCTCEGGTGLNRWLKLSSAHAVGANTQTSAYGYDPQLDYLTSETINNNGTPTTLSWSYDAVTDNLNRATSIGNATIAYTYDSANDPRGLVGGGILGNRLVKTQDGVTSTYGWDALNRMTSYTSGGITTSYAYRADGMRVSKSDTTGSAVYRYDGQMCMQDVETVGSTVTTTNYALGARGIDAVSKTVETFQNGQWVASPAQVGYPIYDAHGDRVATLTKSGTSFSLTDVRTYDAWGNVRVGAQTGRPRSRYCANLGHVQDDESGLVYMRARYYEPGSGRFMSEDSRRQGRNWFTYASGDPVDLVDPDGQMPVLIVAAIVLGVAAFCADFMAQYVSKGPEKVDYGHAAFVALVAAATPLIIAAIITSAPAGGAAAALLGVFATDCSAIAVGQAILGAIGIGSSTGLVIGAYEKTHQSPSDKAVDAAFGRNFQVASYLAAIDLG